MGNIQRTVRMRMYTTWETEPLLLGIETSGTFDAEGTVDGEVQ